MHPLSDTAAPDVDHLLCMALLRDTLNGLCPNPHGYRFYYVGRTAAGRLHASDFLQTQQQQCVHTSRTEVTMLTFCLAKQQQACFSPKRGAPKESPVQSTDTQSVPMHCLQTQHTKGQARLPRRHSCENMALLKAAAFACARTAPASCALTMLGTRANTYNMLMYEHHTWTASLSSTA